MKLNMKRTLAVIASALMLGIFANAQEFVPGWNLQFRGGIGETIGETVWDDLLSPALDFSAAYQYSPVIGFRGDLLGVQGKGAMNGVQGATALYKFGFAQLGGDITIDLANIAKYNYKRIVSPYIYGGLAFNFGLGNKEANDLVEKGAMFEHLWKGVALFPGLRGGAGFDIRLSDAVKLNIEAGINSLSDRFNSKKNLRGSILDMDYHYTAMAGLKITLGDQKPKVHEHIIVPQNRKAAPAPAPKPAPVVKQEVQETLATEETEFIREIYFEIDHWNIQDAEKVKIDEIAAYMNKNPQTTVSLSSHADKTTGSSTRNQFLSDQRAKAVTSELTRRGISASRITSESKGDTANPHTNPENNRVTICIVK